MNGEYSNEVLRAMTYREPHGSELWQVCTALLALREKLANNRCNSGHETLPLALWDCPECGRLRVEKVEKELAAAREKLKALEPRPVTCDDEWICDGGNDLSDIVWRFHDFDDVEAARESMRTATCRIIRVPVAAAEPEPIAFLEAEAKAYFRKHGGLTEADRGLPGTPKTASASMAPEPFLKNEEPGEKTRPYDVFRAEADRILAARAPEPAAPQQPEKASMNTDPAKCGWNTDGYWCTPFTCQLCNDRYDAGDRRGYRPLSEMPQPPHQPEPSKAEPAPSGTYGGRLVYATPPFSEAPLMPRLTDEDRAFLAEQAKKYGPAPKPEPAPLKVGDRVRVLHENFVGESGKIMDVRTDARFLYGVRLVENAALYWFHADELERIPAAEEPIPKCVPPTTERSGYYTNMQGERVAVPPIPKDWNPFMGDGFRGSGGTMEIRPASLKVQHLERKIERQRAQLRLMERERALWKVRSILSGWGPDVQPRISSPRHRAALRAIVESSSEVDTVRKAALALLGEKP